MGYSSKEDIPISEKLIISAEEASRYSGIGIHRLEKLLRQSDCPFVIRKGNRHYVKREVFRDYLNSSMVTEI